MARSPARPWRAGAWAVWAAVAAAVVGVASAAQVQFTAYDEQPRWAVEPGVIPDYITRYAPMVHLYSEEIYLPCDVDDFIAHMFPVLDGQNITANVSFPMTRADVGRLPRDADVFLTSDSDFDVDPDWITGARNRIDVESGRCDAPAILIVYDKGDGWVDSFWFYFYSFNLGPFVMGGGPYGNHIGDWEHSILRFHNGRPHSLWMSAHGGGSGFTFEALEKAEGRPERPVIYSGRGTHANYGSTGQHSHDLPFRMLSDFTDRGPLWDPAANFLGYTYDGETPVSANAGDDQGADWLLFPGHWGDKKLPPDDPRQRYHPFEWRYIDGPTGPLFKHLDRAVVCQQPKWYNWWGGCRVRNTLEMGEGVESEGFGCAGKFDHVRPALLGRALRFLLWGGYLCGFVDWMWG
ncbi:uncharacterized protein V1510DRAFT_370976 [Dipodascopsis tothii]|uniref:uncharacterized protein n=1 Tax=Dipodascopsis tothii TaxID=44089 RepID=UPI0034CF7EF5